MKGRWPITDLYGSTHIWLLTVVMHGSIDTGTVSRPLILQSHLHTHKHTHLAGSPRSIWHFLSGPDLAQFKREHTETRGEWLKPKWPLEAQNICGTANRLATQTVLTTVNIKKWSGCLLSKRLNVYDGCECMREGLSIIQTPGVILPSQPNSQAITTIDTIIVLQNMWNWDAFSGVNHMGAGRQAGFCMNSLNTVSLCTFTRQALSRQEDLGLTTAL